MAKGKGDKTEDCCPNCGYCPHCGQSASPPVVPMPYPQPYPVPYRRPMFEEGGLPYRVWCGTTTPREGAPELRSISVSYVEAETAGLATERLA